MQPPSAPAAPVKGKLGGDNLAGYARTNTGKWAWNQPGANPNLIKSKSVASFFEKERVNYAAPQVSHPAKDLKALNAANSKNFVGSEFKDAGQVGLEIWRMENMTAKAIPKANHGKFHIGDAYIVLNVTSEKSSNHHIHFWIGKESSQDKYGTAAYKTVELDNKFTGTAIHHREEQGKESTLFKSYFPNGIEYLEGGTASSFKHVQREQFAKRLLHLKGRRSVRAKQVEATYKSLNTGDVFVLDVGRTIFQWNGSGASRTERVKGVEIIRNIKDNERGGRATIIVVEHSKDEKLNQNKKAEQFWEALGDKGPIMDGDLAGDDDEFEKQVLEETILHKIYVERDQVKTELVTTRPLKKEILDPHHAYVLDAATEVFLWIGKSTSANQKNFATDFAKKIHSEKVSWAPFVKIVQGAETPMFKEKFDNWKQLFPKNLDYSTSAQLLPAVTKRAEYPKEEIDLEKLITEKPKPRPENALMHAGTGVLKIWKIEDFKKVEIPETQHGIFFSASCYICLYVEMKEQRRSHYIYFWQGRHSSKENKGTSALLVKEMADSIRGKQQQFRVVHNKEPEHFVMLFKGKMIIGMGAHPKTREELGGLYQIKHHPNNWEWHVKAAQVPMTSESLNSNDVFVIVAADRKCFVWVGIGSSSRERKIAKLVAARLVGDINVGKIVTVDENKEVSFFWPYFPGGKKDYASAEYLKWNSKSPRLFQCSNTTGTFKVEEIFNFTQEDLDMDDPFILDCHAEVYVWVGTGSNELEKKFAMQTAVEYVAKAATIDERDPSTPIYYVTPGEEPMHFKCHFLAWDNDLIADSKNKNDDDDDGTPLKSSIVFKPSSFNPEPQKPIYPALKAQPAPDPNRPKISFSYPITQPAQPATEAAKPEKTPEAKPALSYSYPKSTNADQPAATTPRGTVTTKYTPPSPLKTSGEIAKGSTSEGKETTATVKFTPPNPLKTSSDAVTAKAPATKYTPPTPLKKSTDAVVAKESAPPVQAVSAKDESTPVQTVHASAVQEERTPAIIAKESAPPVQNVTESAAPEESPIQASAGDVTESAPTQEPAIPTPTTTTVHTDPVPIPESAPDNTQPAHTIIALAPTSISAEIVPVEESMPTESSSPLSPLVHATSPSTTEEHAAKVGASEIAPPTSEPDVIIVRTPELTPTITTPPVKPAFSLSLSSLASPATSAASSATTTTNVTPAEETSKEPVTPGRASRPPWIKTKAETTKIIASLTPSAPKSNPVVVAVLSPRKPAASTPPQTTTITTITASTSQASSTNTTNTNANPPTQNTPVHPLPAVTAFLHTGPTASIASAASAAITAAITVSTTSPAPSSPTLSLHSTANTSTTTTTSTSISAPVTAGLAFSSPAPAEQKPKPSQEFQKINIKPKVGLVHVELAKYNREFYTFEELSARKKPPGVDVTCLEKYLVDAEFEQVFGMTKEKFYAIPVWKRVSLRKDKKLY